MSLAETQEIMTVLQEIMRILDNVNVKSEQIIQKMPKLTEGEKQFKDLERLALRYLALAKRMGLPDEIDQAMQIIAQLVVMIRMLQISIAGISGGGIGALIGIAGVISVTMTANDMLGYDAMRGY